jgi:hypothetical protein
VAAPAVGVGARIAVALLDDLLIWGILALAIALFVLLLPILLPILGFGAILALFSGLSGVPQGAARSRAARRPVLPSDRFLQTSLC